MTTPQTKFFDTVKKRWVRYTFGENHLQLFCDENNIVHSVEHYLDTYVLKKEKYIIAVPFTGLFDINQQPLYLNDVGLDATLNGKLKMHVISRKIGVGFLLQSISMNTKYSFSQRDASQLQIIGSSLTNPELLNE